MQKEAARLLLLEKLELENRAKQKENATGKDEKTLIFFVELLTKGIDFADLVISTKDKEVRAHKPILAARCPQLLAMAKSNLLLSWNSDTVESLLRFVYANLFDALLPVDKILPLCKLSMEVMNTKNANNMV